MSILIPSSSCLKNSKISNSTGTKISNNTEIANSTEISDNTEPPSRQIIFPEGYEPPKLVQHHVIHLPVRTTENPCGEKEQKDSHGNCRQRV